jgi:hypothetical protein
MRMIFFVNDNNESISYEGEFLLTKQAISFYNFKIKGDVSINFNIPNTSDNRRILGYHGFNQGTNPAFSQIPFNVTRDGNIISRGYIVIVSDNGEELECFYLSGNTWINSLNQSIKQFDYDEYTVYPDDYNSVNEMVIDAVSYGKNYGIVFPLVDWSYEGQKGAAALSLAPQYQIEIRRFIYLDEWSTKDYFPEVLPVVYLHTVMSQIAKKSNIKLSGDIFDDQVYNRMVITPETVELEWPEYFVNETIVNAETILTTPMLTGYQKVSIETQTYPNGVSPYDQVNSQYTAKHTGIYNVTLNWVTDTSQNYLFRIYKNGSYVSGDQSIGSVVSNTEGTVTGYVYLQRGDYLEIYANGGTAYNVIPNTSIEVQLAKSMYYEDFFNYSKGPYIPVNAIVPDIKAIDLIKFIVNYFGCVATFDQYTQTLTINKTVNYLDSIDWSSNVKGYEIQYNNDVAQNNYIKFSDVEDDLIKTYNEISPLGYANGNIEATRVKQERIITEFPFGPALDVFNTNFNTSLATIGLVKLTPKNTFEYTSITQGGNYAVLNGTFEGIKGGINQLVYVTGTVYNGYYIVLTASATAVTINAPYLYLTDSGTVATLQKDLRSSESRVLLMDYVSIFLLTESQISAYKYGATTISWIPYGWFYRQNRNTYEDPYFKQSLAINDPSNISYGNITISEAYYSKLNSAFQAPGLKTTMLLDENTFQSFDFTKLVFLNTGDINGYFFVDSIVNYKDAITPVEVNLIPASFKQDEEITSGTGTYNLDVDTGTYIITGNDLTITTYETITIQIKAQYNTGLRCKIYYKKSSDGIWAIAPFGVVGPNFGSIIATTTYQTVTFPLTVVDGETISFAIQNFSDQNVAFGTGNGGGYFGKCGKASPYTASLSVALGTNYINVAASAGGYTTC